MTTETAAPYPRIGCVMITTAHEHPGPTMWSGNKQNRAIGWYWFQATSHDGVTVRSEVFKRRREAEKDAKATFINIVGWKADTRIRYAIVRPHS